MKTMLLRVSLASSDQLSLFSVIRKQFFSDRNPPDKVLVDYKRQKPIADWYETWIPKSKQSISAIWGGNDGEWITYTHHDALSFQVEYAADVEAVAQLLGELPFTVAVFDTLHPSWSEGDHRYAPPGFGDRHFALGWGCAFKGDGHQQLVSRRWLDFGPWRLRRYPNDLSLVQFHDLDGDAETALAQARPGHERMGISDTGGYVQTGYVYTHQIGGTYLIDERRLKIAVHDRDITPLEMCDAAAVKRYQSLGPEHPVDRIAYVFMDEHDARRYLHELWLYGLECWAFIMGKQERLDTDYHPTPEPPAWARRLGTDALRPGAHEHW